MRRSFWGAVVIATVLSLLVGWELRQLYQRQKSSTHLRDAEGALEKSNVELALRFAAQVPEGTPEFEKAHQIEARALDALAEITDRQADEAEHIIRQIAQLSIEEESLRHELATVSPASQRALKLKQDLAQLETLEHKLVQSNGYTAAGYGAPTDRGREEALAIAYQMAAGHAMDDQAKIMAKAIVEQRGLQRGAAKRRDFAASFQAGQISRGSSISYSTEGDFDRVLVLRDYGFTDTQKLRRITLVMQRKDVARLYCDAGFTDVELKLPNVSSTLTPISLDCGSSGE
jgi:hypothetical protein